MHRLLLVLAVLLGLPATAAAAPAPAPCTGDAQTLLPIRTAAGGTGIAVAPPARPTALVLLGHGYSFTSDAMRDHLRRTVQRTGALALALDYRGLRVLGEDPRDDNPYTRSSGFPVKAGGEDLVAAAQEALRACPTLRHVVLLGISMGGNATGLAVALRARRDDGRPLFDHWFGVEGAYDLTLLHSLARLGSPIDGFVDRVRRDIEAEAGGTPETAPAAYAERTVTQRVDDLAAARPRGVTLVHGIEDGLAVYPQAEELARLLRARGVPTDLLTAYSRGPMDTPDTTLAGYGGARTGLAGHGPEWSPRHVVITTAFRRLEALLGGAPPPCDRDLRVEGAPRDTITPDPDRPAPGCPAGTVLSRPGTAAAAPCALPRVTGIRVRRARRDLVVTGRVRGRCGAARRTRVRAIAGGRRAERVLPRAGRFTLRVRGARRASVAVVRAQDVEGRGRAVRVRVR